MNAAQAVVTLQTTAEFVRCAIGDISYRLALIKLCEDAGLFFVKVDAAATPPGLLTYQPDNPPPSGGISVSAVPMPGARVLQLVKSPIPETPFLRVDGGAAQN